MNGDPAKVKGQAPVIFWRGRRLDPGGHPTEFANPAFGFDLRPATKQKRTVFGR